MQMPKSINIVSIVVIVFSASGIYSLLKSSSAEYQEIFLQMGLDQATVKSMLLFGFLSIAITIVCAFGWRYGQNWARLTYIGSTVLSSAASLTLGFTDFVLLIPGLVVFAVVVFFLYRPAANAFFASK